MINKQQFKGIYYHIPFCTNICAYCDFAKVYYNKQQANQYLVALANEHNQYNLDLDQVETIYIGGGTPSSLDIEQLKQLFKIINAKQYPNLSEFSIEVNPENMDLEKIKLMQSNGINRVSIGVQSFNDHLLKQLNRPHNRKQIIQLIKDLKVNGIDNISIDLMYGFADQSINDIQEDLNFLKQFSIQHVSAYSLIIEPGSILYNQNYEKDEENDFLLEQFLHQGLADLGFEHYEVSNFALNKQYSKHNLLYWSSQPYLGLGLGAGSFINKQRWYNTKSLTNYLKGDYNRIYEDLENLNDQLSDSIITMFRVYNGIDLDFFMSKYGVDFEFLFKDVIIKNEDNLYIENNKLYFTKKGQQYLNDVIVDFINKLEE